MFWTSLFVRIRIQIWTGSFHLLAKIPVVRKFLFLFFYLWIFIFEEWGKCTVPYKIDKQSKNSIFFGILKVNDEKSRTRIRIRTGGYKISRILNTGSYCTYSGQNGRFSFRMKLFLSTFDKYSKHTCPVDSRSVHTYPNEKSYSYAKVIFQIS